MSCALAGSPTSAAAVMVAAMSVFFTLNPFRGQEDRTAMSLGPALENLRSDRTGGEGIGPACVEGDLRNHLSGLFLREAVVQGPVQVACELGHLPIRHQRGDGHEAAVAWRQVGAQPHVLE